MSRRKENKKLIIIIVIISILLVISLFFAIVFGRYYFIKINEPQYGLDVPNNNTCTNNSDVEKIDVSYVMDKKRIVEFEKYGEEFLDKYQGRKYIKYPVILGEHNSVLDLNDKIKDKVDNYIDEFYLGGEIINASSNVKDLCYVDVLEDGSQKNYCNYLSLQYTVFENDKYISVIEDEILNVENSSGDIKLNDIYTIDKSTGIVVSNEDVVKNMGNLSLMKNNLVKYVKENYSTFSYFDVWEIKQENFVADLDILLSTSGFKVFFEENTVYFYFSKIQGVDDIVFRYKNEEWEEYSSMYGF